jgi:hypothetical protein
VHDQEGPTNDVKGLSMEVKSMTHQHVHHACCGEGAEWLQGLWRVWLASCNQEQDHGTLLRTGELCLSI